MSRIRRLQVVISLVCLVGSGQALATVCRDVPGYQVLENTGIPATTPSADFTAHADGTAIHLPTGLMWKRCSQGQSWNPDTAGCDNSSDTFDWAGALVVAAEHTFAGYSDWRLPNRKELASLVEERCWSPSINVEIFPQTPQASYWTSSPFPGEHHWDSWVVEFGGGTSFNTERTLWRHVRLVRTAEAP